MSSRHTILGGSCGYDGATGPGPDFPSEEAVEIGRTDGNGARSRSLAPVLSPSRIGDVNRSRVLQALCDLGPLSRADLARMAGVPRATISGIVRPLLESKLIEEGQPDRHRNRVGKPGRPLWFRSKAGLSGAVALRGDTCETALVSARGEILADHAADLSDPADPKAVLRDILGGLSRVLPSPRPDILGIGVAVPGVCDTAGGRVIGSSQIPGLTGFRLAAALGRRLGASVLIDNDCRAQALGEKWFGEGRGVGTFAAIQTGHGLGVGLVMNGQVFRGEDGRVGEIGHVPVVPGGARCRCGLRGCWETIATLPWVRSEARRRGLPGAARMDARALTALARSGSRDARALLDRYADHLAIGLALLMQLVNPRRLILHGDAGGGGEDLRRRIEERTRARALPYLRAGVDVVLSRLDQQATLLGSAGLVLSETFNLAT
ncbi:MAG: ROK family transcriptional regulator [Acidobacteria bacterium]|nr:ROK family transcriptional regulator [Acidobacteriota bacterium]